MENDLNTNLLGAPEAVVDVSLWGLFLQADIVVKIVMLLLLLASIWTWTIIFYKSFRIRRLNREADAFEDRFWSGASLDDLYDEIGDEPNDPMASVFSAAMKEWRHTSGRGMGGEGVRAGLQARIDKAMSVTIGREMGELERGMTFLASVGSTAPFIGLFGTVWGIMNSFISIAGSGNTSLAVVAPGIAEALFATALGLFAAIPASAAYNKFSSDLSKYGDRLDTFSGEFSTILARFLDDGRG